MVLISKQLVIQMLHNNDKFYDLAILCLMKKCLLLSLLIRIASLFISEMNLVAVAIHKYSVIKCIVCRLVNIVNSMIIFIQYIHIIIFKIANPKYCQNAGYQVSFLGKTIRFLIWYFDRMKYFIVTIELKKKLKPKYQCLIFSP